MSFFRQLLGCGCPCSLSFTRSPIRFTFTSSSEGLTCWLRRIAARSEPLHRCSLRDRDSVAALRQSCLTKCVCCIVLPHQVPQLLSQKKLAYRSGALNRLWPPDLSEKTLINEARQHHRLMMEESLMKGHLKSREAATGQWKMLMKLVLPVIEARPQSPEWPDSNAGISFGDGALAFSGKWRKCKGVIWGNGVSLVTI